MLSTLKGYKLKYLPKDIFAGLIIAAMSIPISMGYALVSGMPAIYGLYGSVFPIIVFAFISTSPQFIFGVDAAPCAVVGGFIASAGIAAGSVDAVRIVPIITFFAACWLLLFSVLKFGKAVNYISLPVMGGFISGIAFSIIMMQIPKLYGGKSGNGEFFELLSNILETVRQANLLSLALGAGTIAAILLCKKFAPKFPMPVVMMILGAVATKVFHIDKKGVLLLSAVSKGMPKFSIPSFGDVDISECIGISITVAIVILAETLLSENNFAMKNNYKIKDNNEIFAFSMANFVGAFCGCPPINGSVSRTSMNDQFGGKTQLTSIIAGASMILVLLFATDFISLLPVPVLTAIVICALMGVIEVDLAKRLRKVKKSEYFIFLAAFFAVVMLGTIYGVVIGVVLSFMAVIIRCVNPGTDFLGAIPGREGFHSLGRNKNAFPIEGVVIYRFSGDLFFGNIKTLQKEIDNQITDDTKVVIIDAGGISSIDITAADYLEAMSKNFQQKGIHFYITEHIGALNDQMRRLGIGYLIEEGVVRRTITAALTDCGFNQPYKVNVPDGIDVNMLADTEDENSLQEFVWAFGDDAKTQMEKQVQSIVAEFANVANEEQQIKIIHNAQKWGGLGSIDEDDLINRLELHIAEIAQTLNRDEVEIEQALEERRHRIVQRLKLENPDAYNKLKEHRKELEKELSNENPEAYKHLQHIRKMKRRKLQSQTESRERYRITKEAEKKAKSENNSEDKTENKTEKATPKEPAEMK